MDAASEIPRRLRALSKPAGRTPTTRQVGSPRGSENRRREWSRRRTRRGRAVGIAERALRGAIFSRVIGGVRRRSARWLGHFDRAQPECIRRVSCANRLAGLRLNHAARWKFVQRTSSILLFDTYK